MSNTGQKFKEVRSALGLSQEELGLKIGLTKSGVSNVEKNKSFMSSEVLNRLIVNYNVNINYLISGKGEIFLNNCENTHAFIKNENAINNYKNWGNRLSKLLSENETTPAKFSKITGISENRIEKFILDSLPPSIDEVNAIKSNVDVLVDWLLYGETHENSTQTGDVGLSADEILKIKKLLNKSGF